MNHEKINVKDNGVVLASFPKYIIYPDSKVFGKKSNRFLQQQYDKVNGYFEFSLFDYMGVRKHVKTHRLLALAFLPNPYNKPQINHINGIKTDNRLDNLEWCTSGENTRHAFQTGLIIKPKKIFKRKGPGRHKKVIDLENGHVFDSVTEAATAWGLKKSTLVMMLKGNNKNRTTLKYYE